MDTCGKNETAWRNAHAGFWGPFKRYTKDNIQSQELLHSLQGGHEPQMTRTLGKHQIELLKACQAQCQFR